MSMNRIGRRYFYIRNKKNDQKLPQGLVCFTIDNNKMVNIGWSLCHEDDNFSKKEARNMAETRIHEQVLRFHLDNSDQARAAIRTQIPHRLQRTASFLFGDIYAYAMRMGL